MLQTAMINDHRRPTPAGVCLSGDTVRCPSCNCMGALEGYLFSKTVALCSHCGHGYPTSTAKRTLARPAPKADPVTRLEIRERLNTYRKANGLRWKMLAMLLNSTSPELSYTANSLGVACSPSSGAGAAYLSRLAKALNDLEAAQAEA